MFEPLEVEGLVLSLPFRVEFRKQYKNSCFTVTDDPITLRESGKIEFSTET